MHHRHSHHSHRGQGHADGRRFAHRGHGPGGHFPAHRGRGPGRGGPQHGLGRLLAHGDLRLAILHLIAERPRHGYDLIKAVEERTGGAYAPSPGVIYPTLTMLEEMGHATVRAEEGGGTRKLYELTEEGRAFLDANRPALDALLARLDEAGRVHGGGPAPQVTRAMENLRLALRLRLARGPLNEDQANAVAAALDTAATAVERS